MATVLAWAGILWLTNFHDREDAVGLLVMLFVAPAIAFAAGSACAMVIVTPRPQGARHLPEKD